MRKIITECDVADTVLRANDRDAFWQLLRLTNPEYRKTAKSLASSGDRDIKRNLITTLSNCDEYFRNVPTRPELYELSENIARESGIHSLSPVANLTFTDENDIAIFGYPNGYIFITHGLYQVVNGDTAILHALFAAETAHYALQHAYAHQKYEKKRRNRHRFWRIFGAVAITSASIIAEEATDGYFPSELGIMAAGTIAISEVRDRYTMQYTPIQIHEADIIAYRYCQLAFGSGEPYIKALCIAGNDIDATSFHTKDAPTVADRIALLKYMENHPELRQKVKIRTARPRQVKKYSDPFSPSNYR